jgi:hypothetical protein
MSRVSIKTIDARINDISLFVDDMDSYDASWNMQRGSP